MKKSTKKKQRDKKIEIMFNEAIKKIAFPLFKNGLKLNDREFESVIFVVTMILYCEKHIEGLCLHIINRQSAAVINKEINDYIFEELTFSSKINILEKILKKSKCYGKLIKDLGFFRELNQMRNNIFHCKIKNIKYKGKSIIEEDVKFAMVKDFLATTEPPKK